MKFHSFCPRCNSELTAENHHTGVAICDCGWFDGLPQATAQAKTEKKAIYAMLAFGVAMTIGFGHLQSWGSYATSIPFTKLAQLTGTLSPQGYRELAQACIELNKWSCAEEALIELTTSAGDVEGFAMLGSLRSRLKQHEGALVAYEAYEKKGGKNPQSLVKLGLELEIANRDGDAIRVYEKSIAASPEVLPVQATTGIVRMMIKTGRYEEAYVKILEFQASAENAKGYLNTELAQLEKQLGTVASRKIEKKTLKNTDA